MAFLQCILVPLSWHMAQPHFWFYLPSSQHQSFSYSISVPPIWIHIECRHSEAGLKVWILVRFPRRCIGKVQHLQTKPWQTIGIGSNLIKIIYRYLFDIKCMIECRIRWVPLKWSIPYRIFQTTNPSIRQSIHLVKYHYWQLDFQHFCHMIIVFLHSSLSLNQLYFWPILNSTYFSLD